MAFATACCTSPRTIRGSTTLKSVSVSSSICAVDPLSLPPAVGKEDVLDPERKSRVPITFLTDGEWIRSGATAYYLEQYSVAPDAEFVEHIKNKDYICRDVPEDVVRDASVQIQEAPQN